MSAPNSQTLAREVLRTGYLMDQAEFDRRVPELAQRIQAAIDTYCEEEKLERHGSDSTSSLHSSPVAGHCEEAAPSSVRLDAVAVAKICKSGDPHGCGYPDCDCVRHSQRSAEYVSKP